MKNYNSEKTAETMSVATFLNGGSSLIPLSINHLKTSFPNYENSKYSVKSMQYIRAYAANTNQGIIRNYNEDRVSIILNIMKPTSYTGKDWPKSSFFAIYDGHGGAACADFLRDNLHQYIIKDSNFPSNPSEAIRKGCEQAEKDFLTQHALNKNQEIIDRSGSCAIFALIIEDTCYMANIGDSRGIMSTQHGKKVISLTNDHKPNDEKESKRIVDNGGKVYQTQTNAKNFNLPSNSKMSNDQILLGPHRVFPGRLSVSRTFGDVEAKLSKFGGLSGVIISVPDITQFKINQDMDFIMLGCDGIFDQVSNKEAIDCVWMTMKESKAKNIHIQCGMGIDLLIKTSLVRRTLDNVTAVVIAFQNFENFFNGQTNSSSSQRLDKNYKSNLPEPKSSESKKIETNYHSNKENTSFKLKEKFNEEDKKEKNVKFLNTPQNNKANNAQFSLNHYSGSVKKGKDDSGLDVNANIEKNVQTKLNINVNNDEGYHKSNQIIYSDNKAQREFIPSTTKNQKSGSFKGDLLKK